MSERRDVPREEVSASILCRVGKQTFEARTRNVSTRGVYFETAFLFDPTQEVRMAIDLPGQGTVSAVGRTTRIVASKAGEYQVGVAVQFLENDSPRPNP